MSDDTNRVPNDRVSSHADLMIETIKGEKRAEVHGGEKQRPGVVVLFCESGAAGPCVAMARAGHLSVGRQADCHLHPDDPKLSRRHATLLFDAGGPRLRDEGSSNGSFVAGVQVEGEVPVAYGEVIRCGTTLLMPVRDLSGYLNWPHAAQKTPLWGGPHIEAVRKRIAVLAPRPIDVLVLGESGTGKERVSQMIHEASGRTGPLIAVNCAALPETLFEAELFGVTRGAFTGADRPRSGLVSKAQNGTLFLDEVGELPLGVQAKLLRVIEEREVRPLGDGASRKVDIRLVAATNRDLENDIKAGRFRSDLYHRLCGATVSLLPLRERREDIAVLIQKFLLDHAQAWAPVPRLTAPFVEKLLVYGWPGNVRELYQVMRESLVNAKMTGEETLEPDHVPTPAPLASSEHNDIHRIRKALTMHKGNVVKAAADMHVSRRYIYEQLKKHNLTAQDFRDNK